jgi:hypothetical protein
MENLPHCRLGVWVSVTRSEVDDNRIAPIIQQPLHTTPPVGCYSDTVGAQTNWQRTPLPIPNGSEWLVAEYFHYHTQD